MNIKTSSELQKIIADRVKTEPVQIVAGDLRVAEVYLLQIVGGQRSVSKKVAERMGYKVVPQPKPEKIFTAIE